MQVCTVRYVGLFLADSLDVRWLDGDESVVPPSTAPRLPTHGNGPSHMGSACGMRYRRRRRLGGLSMRLLSHGSPRTLICMSTPLTVLEVPQWQGSGAPNASRLSAGARTAAQLVDGTCRVAVATTERPGAIRNGVRALDELAANAVATREALSKTNEPWLTVGGECNADLTPIAVAHERYGDDLTLVWIDAHPDVYAPGELSSGSFHAMVVRTLLGEGPAELVPDRPLRVDQVRLAGRRVVTEPEVAFLARSGLRWHGVADAEEVLVGLAGPVHLHIDLDVLDPSEFTSVGYSEPNGMSVDQLVTLITRIQNVVSAAICEYAPGQEPVTAEEDVIKRIAAAFNFRDRAPTVR